MSISSFGAFISLRSHSITIDIIHTMTILPSLAQQDRVEKKKPVHTFIENEYIYDVIYCIKYAFKSLYFAAV